MINITILHYNINSFRGSSGSPIFLEENLKIIGMHRGKKGYKHRIGIPISLIIDKINKNNFIKSIKSNIGKIISKECIDSNLIVKKKISRINNSVFKILTYNNKNEAIYGTGFICYIPSIKINILITNNHVLDFDSLYNQHKLTIFDFKENKKIINLKLNRYKYTNKELDFTLIEILEQDHLSDYLFLDEFIHSKDYENEDIFCIQFPKGGKLTAKKGKILKKKVCIFIIN